MVDPESQEITVFRTVAEAQVLTLQDTLRGEGVLEGFALSLAELFADD